MTRPADYTPYTTADREALLKTGAALFADTSLSSNGLSCASCHNDLAGYMQTFANPYPHPVHMASSMFGMDQVHLDEMVQLCMVAPMAADPLPWGSMELAALTAFMEEEQKRFQANPCAAKGSCAANPCAANPCAVKNPCATKNPCAANPCAANPCAVKNPCKAKAA
ncbi:hypothetical protein [Nitrincola alkalilacustris]|uniref:hypothetical protein n=1 Tax=Nitrincola alkalilacustris TaxID=1571224 RepID=UPI00124E8206|nr:hypothetical protein [Nitrincola alkalilacustris]